MERARALIRMRAMLRQFPILRKYPRTHNPTLRYHFSLKENLSFSHSFLTIVNLVQIQQHSTNNPARASKPNEQITDKDIRH